MNKKLSRAIGLIMLSVAVIFVIYALNHPEAGFNIPLNLTYGLYTAYILAMVIFLIGPFRKKR